VGAIIVENFLGWRGWLFCLRGGPPPPPPKLNKPFPPLPTEEAASASVYLVPLSRTSPDVSLFADGSRAFLRRSSLHAYCRPFLPSSRRCGSIFGDALLEQSPFPSRNQTRFAQHPVRRAYFSPVKNGRPVSRKGTLFQPGSDNHLESFYQSSFPPGVEDCGGPYSAGRACDAHYSACNFSFLIRVCTSFLP